MATITLASNATPAMASVLPKFVTPADIAKEASIFSIMSPEFVTGDAAVTAVRNLGTGDREFTQSTSVNQPSMSEDTDLGRKTLTFASSKEHFMTYGEDIDYSGPWTMLAVFRLGSGASADNYTVMGSESGAGPEFRANILVANTNRIRARAGSEAAQSVLQVTPGEWCVAIGSFDGNDTVSLWTPVDGIATNTVTTPPGSSIPLYLGDNETAFGMYGAIDMAARFELDVLDGSNEVLFDNIRNMLSRYYGGRIEGLA